MAVRLIEQTIRELEMKVNCYSIWSDLATLLQCLYSFNRKQQIFVVNRVVGMLDTTDISRWNYVSGINKPASIKQG